nr:MAG TPA: ECF sigma factor [Caudoviricetes sp.]DAT92143.1 MAG TPA: ECF sigma factor [Caudoviricetes sp.]
MAKLTDRQRKQIIAEYVEGDGKVSQQKLADKYHVSRQAISTILNTEKSCEKLRNKKEENTLSMLEYLDSRKQTAQELMEKILALSAEDIAKANLRDKMGALKILSEVFAVKNDTPLNGNGVTVQINVKDCSGEEKHD